MCRVTLAKPLPFRSKAANMTETERVLRFVVGLVGTPVAYAFIARPLEGVLAAAVLVVIVVGGIDLLVSGVRGYCPVYRLVSVPWSRPTSSAPEPGATAGMPGAEEPRAPGLTSQHR